jgi:hypothetical protein
MIAEEFGVEEEDFLNAITCKGNFDFLIIKSS